MMHFLLTLLILATVFISCRDIRATLLKRTSSNVGSPPRSPIDWQIYDDLPDLETAPVAESLLTKNRKELHPSQDVGKDPTVEQINNSPPVKKTTRERSRDRHRKNRITLREEPTKYQEHLAKERERVTKYRTVKGPPRTGLISQRQLRKMNSAGIKLSEEDQKRLDHYRDRVKKEARKYFKENVSLINKKRREKSSSKSKKRKNPDT